MLLKCDVYFDSSTDRVLIEVMKDLLYDVNKEEYLSYEESMELLNDE